jgi:uncharacterized protein (TIGR03067 family)
MKWITFLSLLTGLVIADDQSSVDDVKKEVERLQGSWKFVKVERDGEDLIGQIGDVEMEIKGEEYTAPNIAAKFKLDPSKSPKTIDLSYTQGPAEGQTVKGIYKLDGDSLTICRALAEVSNRPSDFTAPAGSGKMLFQFKR